MQLRPYQQTAIDQIRQAFSEGHKKVLLWMATGGGKTVVFSYILKEMAKKKRPNVMIVRGRQLVDQASQRLIREEVRHGVRMANHWNKDFSATTQICSVDTLTSRGPEFYPEADLVVIDEAHMATSPSYKKILEHYEGKFILSVTATPWSKDGLKHLAEKVIHPVTVQELTDLGFLVPARYFAASNPDLTGVKTRNGDFVEEQLIERMSTITGDIVPTWKKYAENRPSLYFAININHSLAIRDAFNAAGIPAVHLEAANSFDERNQAIKALVEGRIKVITNVGIMCTGVDIPPVACIGSCRPTKSYNLFIQQAGRGTRPYENKKDFLYIDHAGNVLRHGFITDEPELTLDKEPEDMGLRLKRCKICFTLYEESWCPECGPLDSDVDRSTREILVVEGELKEIVGLPETIIISRRFAALKKQAKENGYKRGWIYYRMVQEFSSEVANRVMPKRVVPPWVRR